MTISTDKHAQAETHTPDYEAIKTRQRATWASGDYHMVAAMIVPVAERLCDAVDLRAGQSVLDIATGSGNAAIAAARRLCTVTGVDYVPELLDRARLRASVEGLPVTFRLGDAERLPCYDGEFDVALSTFGVMFAPDQAQTAREILRVVRSGGRIGLANWTPEGCIGAMLKTIGRHVAPPAGLQSPTRWGSEAGIRDLLGDGISSLQTRREMFTWRFASAAQFVEFFVKYYGPTVKAMEALDRNGQAALVEDLTETIARYGTVSEGSLVVPAEYLEVVATRA